MSSTFPELVALEPGQPVGQQVDLDPGQRRDGLDIPHEAAVAVGHRLPLVQETVHRDVDVAQLPGEPRSALDDVPLLDDAPAQARADDGGNRGAAPSGRAEVLEVGVERRGIAVIVVDRGKAQLLLQGAPVVEVAPGLVGEVRGTPGRDDTVGAGGPGRVEPHGADPLAGDAGALQDVVEGQGQAVDRDAGPLQHPAGSLHHRVDQELARWLQDGRVVLVAPVVESDHDPLVRRWHSGSFSVRPANASFYSHCGCGPGAVATIER